MSSELKDKTIFIMTVGEEEEDIITEIYAYTNLDAANEQLHEITYGAIDEDHYRMYHGVLLRAFYIPNNLKGCTPYVIIRNPERVIFPVTSDEGWFHKGPNDPDSLADYIQKLIGSNDAFTSKITIDDVFIFYGKQLSPSLHIAAEETDDEELIDRWNELDSNVRLNTEIFDKKEK